MTIIQLRKKQSLIEKQIAIAHSSGNTEALNRLREWEQDITNKILSSSF